MSIYIHPAHRLSAVLVGALTLVLAGCGSDEGAEVRQLGTSESSTGVGSSSAPAEECVPVNENLESEATQTVEIVATDYVFDQKEYTAEAGVITFKVDNAGDEPHEVAFLPGGGDVPFTDGGVPDEEALQAAGAFELEAFPGGETCNATYDLQPGVYTLFCIVETPDGTTHWEEGMGATLVVR